MLFSDSFSCKQTYKLKIANTDFSYQLVLFKIREALERQAVLQSRGHHVLCNTAHLGTLGNPQDSSRWVPRAVVGNRPCIAVHSICCAHSNSPSEKDSTVVRQRFYP